MVWCSDREGKNSYQRIIHVGVALDCAQVVVHGMQSREYSTEHIDTVSGNI